MEWLTNNGEVCHRACMGWSASIESGKRQHCAIAIPEPILRVAKEQADERARIVRTREVQRRTQTTAKRLAEMQARTDLTLQCSSSQRKPGRADQD